MEKQVSLRPIAPAVSNYEPSPNAGSSHASPRPAALPQHFPSPVARAARRVSKRTRSSDRFDEARNSQDSRCGLDIVAIIAYTVLAMCIGIFCFALYSNLTGADTAGHHIAQSDSQPKFHLIKSSAAILSQAGQPSPIVGSSVTFTKERTEQIESNREEVDAISNNNNNNNNNNKNDQKDNKKRKQKDASLLLPNYGPERHIQMIHGEKDGTIKQDMRVVLFDNDVASIPPSHAAHKRSSSQPIAGAPYIYTQTVERLKALPLFSYLSDSPKSSLEDTMVHLTTLPQCKQKPIFLSMASVGDELYWQLIENFVYTMVKFDTVECSLVICVSDEKCMQLCDKWHFPCYNFQSNIRPLPSVMEQIGEVKLFHIPKALEEGVDVFMLDLDVGFLNDPMAMVKVFYATPKIDIMVQEDMIFIMNRSKAGWKTWFTQPLPNIGLFLCRGNEKTKRVFDIAWTKYQKMEDTKSKMNPGKDQNHVLEAMRIGRGTFGLRYAYFSNSTALLLDKVVLNVDRSVELGGEASSKLLTTEHTLAAHTTCYEHTTKVLGLKATNSFWNPLYYDPLRPTITKPLLFANEAQLLDEVRTLLWLGMVTGRSVIIPNIMGSEAMEKSHHYDGQVFWPGFRVAKIKRERGVASINVNILEPAFYWRVQRDYDDTPEPYIHVVKSSDSAIDIRDAILALGADSPRVVLHVPKNNNKRAIEQDKERLSKWSKDSVGKYESFFSAELDRYKRLPSVKDVSRSTPMVSDVISGLRLCDDIFTPHKGNRSCFQICE